MYARVDGDVRWPAWLIVPRSRSAALRVGEAWARDLLASFYLQKIK